MLQCNAVEYLTLVKAVGEELLPEHVVEDTIRPLDQRQTAGQSSSTSHSTVQMLGTYQVSMTPERKVDT